MLFNSYEFLIFFPIVVLIFYLIPAKYRYLWLTVTSYYYYMCWNAKYAVLIALSTVITYASGLAIARAGEHVGKKKFVVAFCCLSNLGILAFFKYTGWLLDTLNHLTGHSYVLPFSIVLPVGISFYTFQALSYTIDVYRGDIPAERNFVKYALFVSFFPQLVAGPIERSGNLLNQINTIPERKKPNFYGIAEGLIMMVWGFFLKMMIADRVSILVDTVFDSYGNYDSLALFVAAVGFAIQIYCDFSGYSTIAIGAAKVMGFSLMENFNTPFFSKSTKEIWRRWHISLSSWFRDYVYIPLGGSRCSKPRKYFNLMVTFLLSGLWHGASWHFVAWGFINGIYQVIGEVLQPVRKWAKHILHIRETSFFHQAYRCIFTFLLFAFSFIFFRASTVRDGCRYVARMFTRLDPWNVLNGSIYELGLSRLQLHILLLSLGLLFLVSLLRRFKNQKPDGFLMNQSLIARWGILIVMICTILIFGEYGGAFNAQQFIYFQF